MISEEKLNPEEKRRDIFSTVYESKDKIYTKQTGKFLHRSSQENKYQMILNKIDGNFTWIEPIRKKTEGGMILDWRRALDIMKDQGIVPKNQVLDNKILAVYKKEIRATHMTFQLVPQHDHCCNLADKAIQTWKYHFIGVTSGKKSVFPRPPMVPSNNPSGATTIASQKV